ncbi:hypothetical protein GQ55_3G477100 [Panicum hallii var. hallii]|uniref:Uncharacterized protein n=1 Tax=Panicum hallii var. hallii TaxID=1504633 RepID=A0A2T7EJH5_9POAL|nr:hypothetical protein GQ55_3G477100 [Panicum hallii var. hallii]
MPELLLPPQQPLMGHLTSPHLRLFCNRNTCAGTRSLSPPSIHVHRSPLMMHALRLQPLCLLASVSGGAAAPSWIMQLPSRPCQWIREVISSALGRNQEGMNNQWDRLCMYYSSAF